jgi:segregation and condensation protein B
MSRAATRWLGPRRSGRSHPLAPTFRPGAPGFPGRPGINGARSEPPPILSRSHFGSRRAASAGLAEAVGRMGRAACRGRPAGEGQPVGKTPPTARPGVRDDEIARVEAVLFLARDPLPVRRIARLARLADGTRARSLIRQLDALYESESSPFRIETVAGGFQILTHAAFGPWLRRLLDAHSQNRLSPAAMETLAVIAYRQPVSRSEVEAIRGVGCEDMIRQLLDRDLVAVSGRSEEIGRPHLYGTTRRFLRVFGLARLDDLPPVAGPPPADNADAPAT